MQKIAEENCTEKSNYITAIVAVSIRIYTLKSVAYLAA